MDFSGLTESLSKAISQRGWSFFDSKSQVLAQDLSRDASRSESRAISGAMQALHLKVQALEAEKERLTREIGSLKGTKEELAAFLDELQGENENKQIYLKAAEGVARECKNMYKQLKAETEVSAKEFTQYKQQITEYIHQLIQQIKVFSEACERRPQRTAELDTKLPQHHDTKMSIVKELLGKIRGETATVRSKNLELEKRLATLAEQLDYNDSVFTNLQQIETSLRQANRQQRQNLEFLGQTLKNSLSVLASSYPKNTSNLHRYQTKISSLQRQIATLKAKHQEILGTPLHTPSDFDGIKQSLSTLEIQIKHKSSELRQAIRKYQHWRRASLFQ